MLQFNNIKTNSPIEKWAKNTKRKFIKEETQTAKMHKKGCSTSLQIRREQMKGGQKIPS